MRRNIADILLLLVCCVFVNFSLQAQSIQYDATRKPFLLSTSQSSYAVEIGPKSELESVYWGPKLPAVDDFAAAAPRHDISSFDPTQMLDNQEYLGWGGPLYERAGAEDYARGRQPRPGFEVRFAQDRRRRP